MKQTGERLFPLSTEVCQEIDQLVEDFCQQTGTDRKEGIRVRLSVEECLLRWLDMGHEGSAVSLRMGRRFRTPFIRLTMEGAECNPYAETEEDRDAFNVSILTNLGLQPAFRYEHGRNRVLFRLKRKEAGQIIRLGLSLAAAVIVGLLGLFLSAAVREGIRNGLIVPLYQTFVRVLGCGAGPLIFLSVAWGIFGIGDTATFGQVGRRTIFRFLRAVLLGTCWAMLCFPLLGPAFAGQIEQENQFASILALFLDIVPPNIVEPFISGNTLQIIFMAFVMGVALLNLDQRASGVADMIGQLNALVQFLMGGISRMIPAVIFLIVVNLIWSGTVSAVGAAWKLVLASAVMMALAAGFLILHTAWKWKVRPAVLAKKTAPAFLVAFTTASSAASFSVCQETCRKQLGIDTSLTGFGIPMGIMFYRSNVAIFYMLTVFFFAEQYGVSASLPWLVSALLFVVLMAVAAPPVAGAGAVVFSVLFAQLGIPAEAIVIALSVDIVVDFMMTAFNVMGMLLELVNVAGDLDRLDLEKLRKE